MATENLQGQISMWTDRPRPHPDRGSFEIGHPRPLPVERDSYETGPDADPSEQWFFQYHENLLLTVQAVYRLHQALLGKML